MERTWYSWTWFYSVGHCLSYNISTLLACTAFCSFILFHLTYSKGINQCEFKINCEVGAVTYVKYNDILSTLFTGEGMGESVLSALNICSFCTGVGHNINTQRDHYNHTKRQLVPPLLPQIKRGVAPSSVNVHIDPSSAHGGPVGPSSDKGLWWSFLCVIVCA